MFSMGAVCVTHVHVYLSPLPTLNILGFYLAAPTLGTSALLGRVVGNGIPCLTNPPEVETRFWCPCTCVRFYVEDDPQTTKRVLDFRCSAAHIQTKLPS